MATEYCLTYKYTGQSNTNTTPTVAKSKFALSGDTDRKIGRITKIVYVHVHTSTGSPTYELRGRMHFADGSYVDSDAASVKFSSNVKTVTNTFTGGLPSPAQLETWTSIETLSAVTSGSGSLYWQATTSNPMYVYVYFVEGGIMHYGADGTWVECEVYFGADGTWQQVTPYFGADGVWVST